MREIVNGIFSWMLSSVFRPKRNDGCRRDSVVSCALTGDSLPNRRLPRGRDAMSWRFWGRWLPLCVRFDMYRAFPEGKTRWRFVRRTFADSAAVSERRRVSDSTFAVQRPTLSVGCAQVQRSWNGRLVVPVHGHDPGNEEARSPGASGSCAETVSQKFGGIIQSARCCAIAIPFKWNRHRSKHQFVPACVSGVLWYGVRFHWSRVRDMLWTTIQQ